MKNFELKKIVYLISISLYFLLDFVENNQQSKICSSEDVGNIISSCKDSKRKGIYIIENIFNFNLLF